MCMYVSAFTGMLKKLYGLCQLHYVFKVFNKERNIVAKQGSSLALLLYSIVNMHVKVSSTEEVVYQNTMAFYNDLLLLPLDETVSWSDGSPLNYSNWGIREPEFDHLKGNFCISLRTVDGVWQISPCREIKGFVCKKNAGTCFHWRNWSCSYNCCFIFSLLLA